MPGRIAIVLGACCEPGLQQGIESGTHPCTEFARLVSRSGAQVFSYDDLGGSGRHGRSSREQEALNWRLANAIFDAGQNFDSVLAASDGVGLALAATAQARGVRVPINVITHGRLGFNDRHTMLRIRLANTARFLCLSDAVRGELAGRFKIPDESVLNTGYGVDTNFFHATDGPRWPPVVASAGTANRDYRTLVQAVTGIAAAVKIAAGSERSSPPIDPAGQRLPSNVEVRSDGDCVRLRDLYAESLFVVVPLNDAPHACGYSAIAEAMAMGRAVIATKTKAHSDFIVDGETGFYVRAGDPAEMRNKVEHLLAHPELAERMGQCGRLRMTAMFSLDHYCERLERAIAPIDRARG